MTIRLIVKILYLSLFAGSLTGCAHALGKSKSEDLVGLLADSKSKSGVTEEQAAYLEKYLYRHSAIDEVDDYFTLKETGSICAPCCLMAPCLLRPMPGSC